MKLNYYLVVSLLFISISIWLSFNVKQARQKLAVIEANVTELNHESIQLKYELGLVHEAFDLNFNMSAIELNLPVHFNTSHNTHLAILHLKANACSPCNLPVIKEILHNMWNQENFIVVSHPTNRYFLSQVLDEESLNEGEKVNWVSSKLYEQNNGYDAEIFFVGKQNRIMGCLPLEFLKEETLFKKVIKVKI